MSSDFKEVLRERIEGLVKNRLAAVDAAVEAARQEIDGVFGRLHETASASPVVAADDNATLDQLSAEIAAQIGTAAAESSRLSGDLALLRDSVVDIDNQLTQADVLNALVERAYNFAPRVVLFVVKGDGAIAWAARGFEDEIGDDAVRGLSVSTRSETMLGAVLSGHKTYLGEPTDQKDNGVLLDRLGSTNPERIAGIPLRVRGKTVGILYADSYDTSVGSIGIEALELLVHSAGIIVELASLRQRLAEPSRGPSTGVPTGMLAAIPSVPAAEREPVPEPAPEPEPEPVAVVPEPEREPEPEPVEIVPEPEPEPEPEPVPEPEPEPEPVVDIYEPVPEPEPEPAPEPLVEAFAVEPEPEPTVESVPAYETVPMIEAYETVEAEPEPEPAPEPMIDISAPAADLWGAPEVEPEPEPVVHAEPEYHIAITPEPEPEPDAATSEPSPISFENMAPVISLDPEPAPSPFALPDEQPTVQWEPDPPPAPAVPAQRASAPAPGEVPPEEEKLHNDARRFARLLVSEIKLYNEQSVAEGRTNFDLYERLKDDIDRSRQMYDKRVAAVVAEKFDYFYDELVNTLAEGEGAKLGPDCPGPTV